MDIKSNIVVCLAVFLVFVIPISFADLITEENPDDSANKVLSQDSSLDFEIKTLPPGVKKISLWMGDTVRTPLDTPLIIRIGAEQEIHTTLENILRNNRELHLQIHTTTAPLHIYLSAPMLKVKNALSIRTQQKDPTTPAYTLFVRKPLIGALLKKITLQKNTANDIEYVWKEGGEILAGKNPYARAAVDTKNGSKYATYFPLSYIISAGIQKIGYTSFDSWMNIARLLILVSQLISAALVLFYLSKKQLFTLGLLSFFLILFHRFALYPARVTHIDFPAIAMLLAGFMLLSKKPRIACILIGTSLAIKQMAIFIIPALLIYVWHQYKSPKKVITSFLFMALVPIIILAPFVIDNPAGTVRSILFSIQRAATGDFASPDIASTLALNGAWTRIPMLGMLGLVYLAAWRREIHLFGAILAIFTIFVGFNPVLFFQYLAWIIPFVPLAISEVTSPDLPLRLSHQRHDT